MSDPEHDEHTTLTLTPSLPFDAAETRAEPGSGWTGPPALQVRGRITLRGLHSSGGIGEVWRAYDEVLQREVALKRLRQDKADSEINRARFLREAQLTGQLDHPGVVPVYDFSTSEDGRHCFYTMRFLQGRTLAEVIAEFHTARVEQGFALVSSRLLELLEHFTSICNTLAFAHSRGIIHRDLKGDNVIVGEYGEVMVLDWGLAKQLDGDDESAGAATPGAAEPLDPTLTLQGELLGTPAYMAPEQALGWIDRIDARTDVYGLAAILYEILTGQPPFRGPKLDDVIAAVVSEAPMAPSERVAGVPAALERICLRGLEKSMDARPSTVAELAIEVRGWLTDLAERRRTEQERERFFDLSLDLLAIVDQAGQLVQFNPAWSRQLGWSTAELAARPLIELVEPEQRDAVAAALARVWAGAEQADVEVCMRTAQSTRRWVDWNLRSIPGEDAIYGVGRDVTERRRSEREVEGLLESAPDATCVIDEVGTIVRVNAELERMFGYSRTELIGQALELLIPSALRERHRGHVARYVASPKLRPMGASLNLEGQRHDGQVFPIEVSLSPVTTDDRLLIACSLRAARVRGP